MIVCQHYNDNVLRCGVYPTLEEYREHIYSRDTAKYNSEGDRVLAFGKETLLGGRNSNSGISNKERMLRG